MDTGTNSKVIRCVFIAACLVPMVADAQQPRNVSDDGRVSTDVGNAGASQPIRRFRKQALQNASFSSGWLGATDGNDLSSSFFEASIGLGVPWGLIARKVSLFEEQPLGRETRAASGGVPNILGITPSFRVDWIEAAPGLDVPAELFETGVSFFCLTRLCNHFFFNPVIVPH